MAFQEHGQELARLRGAQAGKLSIERCPICGNFTRWDEAGMDTFCSTCGDYPAKTEREIRELPLEEVRALAIALVNRQRRKLMFDFTPTPLWGHSPALMVGLDRWQSVREALIAAANGRCQICLNGPPLTDHAVWEYEDNRPSEYSGVRTLLGFEVICHPCMAVRHVALRERFGVRGQDLLEHYCRVNGVELKVARLDFQDALDLYGERSLVAWKEDLSLLRKMGFEVAPWQG